MSTAELILDLLVMTADAKMKTFLKLMKIRKAKEEYLKNLKELEELRKTSTQTGASASGPTGKKKRKKQQAAASSGADGAGCSKAAEDKEAAEAAEELAAALAEAKRMDERLERERAQCRELAWRLGAEKNALRTVSEADLAKWSAVRLECSSHTVRNKAALQVFLATLAEAPCLAALELSLGNRSRTRRALRAVLGALPSAPADIKELVLTFGPTSLEDVIALLGRVKGHLEKLTVHGPYQHAVYETPAALQRFWTALEESGLTSLELAADHCMKLQDAAGVRLQPAKWRLERLSACFGLGAERTLLPALVRANAATLRRVKLITCAPLPDLKAAFTALAECAGLAEAEVPCCKEAAVLQRCAALSKLSVFASNLILAGSAAEDLKAVAKMLSQPAVVDRVESLSLSAFGVGGSRKAAQVVYKAVGAMRKLKSLSVLCCEGFAPELRATLQRLPLLEELRLGACDEPWPAQALDAITPANAPRLATLRLEPDILGRAPRKLRDAVSALEQRFGAAGRRVQVLVEEKQPDTASPSSDESDDDGDSDDEGLTSTDEEDDGGDLDEEGLTSTDEEDDDGDLDDEDLTCADEEDEDD